MGRKCEDGTDADRRVDEARRAYEQARAAYLTAIGQHPFCCERDTCKGPHLEAVR
jgi:hypothetical protein